MPKPPPPPSGRSKVRVFFVDADFAPGDMEKFTEALTQAVRPENRLSAPPVTVRRLNAGNGKPHLESIETNGDGDVELEQLEEVESDPVEVEAPRATTRTRSYPAPKIVTDLDTNAGGKPFDEFALNKGNPKDHLTRFLIAAAWLYECPKIPTVSMHHVYTCYKAPGNTWEWDLKDADGVFRKMKKEGWGEVAKGKFTINQIGRGLVDKMKPAGV
ncbi:MAG: hypothetical protein ABIT38_20315 [Gemmatimonadaceae bacterium]